jgi:hypothetical protein
MKLGAKRGTCRHRLAERLLRAQVLVDGLGTGIEAPGGAGGHSSRLMQAGSALLGLCSLALAAWLLRRH